VEFVASLGGACRTVFSDHGFRTKSMVSWTQRFLQKLRRPQGAGKRASYCRPAAWRHSLTGRGRQRRRPPLGTPAITGDAAAGRPPIVGGRGSGRRINRGVPGGRPEIFWGREEEIYSVPAASEALAQKRLIYHSRGDSVSQLRWHRSVAGRYRHSTPPQPHPLPLS